MEMNNAVLSRKRNKRNDLSQPDYTYDLISRLSDDELEAIQKAAIVFLNRKAESTSLDDIVPFKPQSEEQLFVRFDHSLAQINPDICEVLEDVVAEMMSEIDR